MRRRRRFRASRRAFRALRAAPLAIRVGIGVLALVALSFTVNWAVSGALVITPQP